MTDIDNDTWKGLWDQIQTVKPTPRQEGLEWQIFQTVDGEELFVDGVGRGSFRRLEDVANEPFEYSVQVASDEWLRGRSERRADAKHAVERVASQWIRPRNAV